MNQTLCFERVENNQTTFRLQPCDDGNDRQLFSGFTAGPKFEFFPYGEHERCLTQEHDPKDYEEIIAETCETARADHSNYWGIYNPVGSYSSSYDYTRTDEGRCILDLDLMDDIAVRVGEPFQSPDHGNIYLEQMSNGNLVVRDGSTILWETGVNTTIGDYYTKLQGDGNMLTRRGIPGVEDGDHGRIWTSDSSAGSSKKNYFLGMDCDGKFIALFSGRPNDLDEMIWSDSTEFPPGYVMSPALPPSTQAPSSSPSISLSPTASPTLYPTTSPTLYPTASPTPYPTRAPPTISPPTMAPPTVALQNNSCKPYFLGLKSWNFIREGWVFRSPDDDTLLLEQWNTGNLAIRDGVAIIWESEQHNVTGSWYTKLQSNGNLETFPGTPDAPTGPSTWESDTYTNWNTNFFLGLDCQRQYVAIYGGTPDYPGSIIWQSPTY